MIINENGGSNQKVGGRADNKRWRKILGLVQENRTGSVYKSGRLGWRVWVGYEVHNTKGLVTGRLIDQTAWIQSWDKRSKLLINHQGGKARGCMVRPYTHAHQTREHLYIACTPYFFIHNKFFSLYFLLSRKYALFPLLLQSSSPTARWWSERSPTRWPASYRGGATAPELKSLFIYSFPMYLTLLIPISTSKVQKN